MHIFRTRHSDSEIAPNAHSDNQGRGGHAQRAIVTALSVLGTISLLGLAACPADLEDPERFNVQGNDAGPGAAGSVGMAGGGSVGTPAPACVVALFDKTCALNGCHKGTVAPIAGLNLEATGLNSRLVDVDAKHELADPATGCVPGKYIDTTNRAASWLLLKLTKTKAELNCGDPMPPGGPFTGADLTCIQDYVMNATK